MFLTEMKKTVEHTKIIAFQQPLRPAPPEAIGPKEYKEYRETLVEMDRILNAGIEQDFILKKMGHETHPPSGKIRNKYNNIRKAFRFVLLQSLTGNSSRELSIRVSDSRLFSWFTSFDMTSKKGGSKSAIDRYGKLFTQEEITDLVHTINQSVSEREQAQRLILENELDFSRHWVDSTCIKADIHFPVDWVLLRDAARSLIGSIEVIRSHGLKHRIGNPQEFVRSMNALVMQFTHTGKKKNGKILRKKILRGMKRLLKKIESHGHRYYELLDKNWQQSDLSRNQAQVILDRLANILSQVPPAIKQASDRIIEGKKVDNACKILSLYESDVHVLIRGKSGAAVEFGNGLYLSENEDGLITDWQFIKEQPPGDNTLVEGSLERLKKHYGNIRSYTGDRGFHSKENSELLEQENIFNGICPKPVSELKIRLGERLFVKLQKRRANTEARIGILKNKYIGKPLRSKGYKHRELRVGWSILTHNLWLLSSIAAENRRFEIETVWDVS
jgi:IS5 family transposase